MKIAPSQRPADSVPKKCLKKRKKVFILVEIRKTTLKRRPDAIKKTQITALLTEVASQEDGFNEAIRMSFEALMKAERQEYLLQTAEDKAMDFGKYGPMVGVKCWNCGCLSHARGNFTRY
ncbi:MAG: hypothetical protein IPK76_02375 [Lewinellaceae bacterium]|nr:hypothetical protein [Lewinellaceae bacterium]